jgi:replicative DNA helicase
MELGIPVFSAAQINREGDKGADKGPRLSELKGSGSLEEDSDTVILMHRPDASDANKRPGETDFNIAKHRNGDTGIVTLGYLKERSLFVSMARDDDTPPQFAKRN